jgi:dipeptidase D
MTLPVSWSPASSREVPFEIKVGGLKGGHSGEDINKQRGNANKIIGRVLDFIQRASPIRLSTLKGGSARNAIPRDAEAVFVCAKESAAICNERFAAIRQTIQTEHMQTEPGLSITLMEQKGHPHAIGLSETQRGIRLLLSLPNGVASMSAEIPGFVETSNNIGIMELKEDGLLIVSNQRSSILSRLEEMAYRVEALALLAEAKVEQTKPSLPWQPNMNSTLRKRCEQVYESTFGRKPKFELSHGGLECGIISSRCGGLDTISLGPTIENPHSPDEQLYLPSLPNVWKFLTEYLKSN